METYKIIYYPAIYQDIDGIAEYIRSTLCAPQAANSLLGKIRAAIERLKNFPLSGTLLNNSPSPYRWVKIDNYMLFYLVDEQLHTVTLMRILYGASDYLSDL